jgi:hypothetical protein
MRIVSLVVAGALASSSTARADVERADDLHGFVLRGDGHLDGHVTDAVGNALPGAQVHVVSDGVERVVSTDRAGDYRVKVATGASCIVFVVGDARITSLTAFTRGVVDSEIIAMREARSTTKLPRLHRRPPLPPYSDAAVDHNGWLRAWVLLDVDASGAVTRVKLLDHPGYDLDPIAVRAAFELELEPARDDANRPMRSQLLWPIDWPAYWWIVDHGDGLMERIPDAAWSLPCKPSGPALSVARSCAPPTLENMLSAPWIDRSAAGVR